MENCLAIYLSWQKAPPDYKDVVILHFIVNATKKPRNSKPFFLLSFYKMKKK